VAAETSTVVVAENRPLAVTVFVVDVRVLFVSVCVSVSPSTTPAGATLVVVTADVPAPIRKLPDVRVVAPMPPLATGSVPVTCALAMLIAAEIKFLLASVCTGKLAVNPVRLSEVRVGVSEAVIVSVPAPVVTERLFTPVIVPATGAAPVEPINI
jgi:hypothetical protein